MYGQDDTSFSRSGHRMQKMLLQKKKIKHIIIYEYLHSVYKYPLIYIMDKSDNGNI